MGHPISFGPCMVGWVWTKLREWLLRCYSLDVPSRTRQVLVRITTLPGSNSMVPDMTATASARTTTGWALLRRDEIRLIELQPHGGDRESPIRANLITRSLTGAEIAIYEALSYVWGGSSSRSVILLSGEEFLITANLELALRQIRHAQIVRRLWVDAICINQTDMVERNAQVVQMDRVYSKSARVLVWLGPENDLLPMKSLVAFLGSMKNNGHIFDCPESSDSNKASCENSLSLLNIITSRPWWDRTWTLQEIILARDADILLGSDQLPWRDLLQALTNLQEHIEGCCSKIKVCFQCWQVYSSFRERVGGLHRQRRRMIESQGLDLFDLLPRYRYRHVTVPHDKVYALLGLALSSQSSRFDPNYDCSMRDLSIKTAVCNMSWSRSLRSLSYAVEIDSEDSAQIYSPRSTECILPLPSWVTDWTSQPVGQGMKTSLQTRYDMYNAARGTLWSGTFRGMKVEPFAEKCTFSTNGVLFDKVKYTGSVCASKTWKEAHVVVREWLKIVKTTPSLNCKRRYVGGRTVKNAFWRTLSADVAETGRRASDIDGEHFRTWWKMVVRGKQAYIPLPWMNEFLENMTTAISRRRFFITERGYMGNGSANVRPGDEIFILCGGNMPLVLRPDPKDTFQQGDFPVPRPLHTLTGDCYLHGIMDGEEARTFEHRSRPVWLK